MSETARKTGRPTLLTAEVEKAILQALAAGADIQTACETAGIGSRTFHTWMRKGEDAEPPAAPSKRSRGAMKAYREALQDWEERAPFRQFRQSCAQARARVRTMATAHWLNAFSKDWKAAEAYLSRVDPRQFAPIKFTGTLPPGEFAFRDPLAPGPAEAPDISSGRPAVSDQSPSVDGTHGNSLAALTDQQLLDLLAATTEMGAP